MDFTKEDFDSVFGTPGQREIERTVRQRHAKIRHEQEMRDDIAVRVLIAMIETTPEAAQRVTEKAIFDLSRAAYLFADAMMAAREGEKKATAEEVVKALQTPITSVSVKITGQGGACVKAVEIEPGCKVVGLDHGKLGTVTGKPSDMHGQIPVKWDGSTHSIYGKPENLEALQRPLKDGDRVTMEGAPGVIQLVVITTGLAVVKWPNRYATWELISSLELDE